jgi:protein-L-isoaspartate(D-aspartate) O-methyltransferase
MLAEMLIDKGFLKTRRVIKAFKLIKRSDFVRQSDVSFSEADWPLPIGHSQTISQPATVAFMLELLQPSSGDKILDVGSGSGWTTALLAAIVGSMGRVYALERILELKEFGQANVNKYRYISNKRVRMFTGDGYTGLAEYAPFDRILVSAAARSVPELLLPQLKVGGRLVMPVGSVDSEQKIVLIERIDKTGFNTKDYPGFMFVPLVSDHE